ncbi:MAG: type IX secretion system membrane protein PorP/SprF [bacterium]
MKKGLILGLAVMMLTGYTTLSYGAFKDSGWGTRPAGMGGAFVAIADDANSPMWNPAGISQIDWHEGSFMYAKLYTGLDNVDMGLNYLSYAQPVSNIGHFGINWANFTTASLYKEDTIAITYARKISDIVAAGINIKYLSNQYTLDSYAKDDPVFSDAKGKSVVTVDLGVLVKATKKLNAGLSIKNLTQPDIGLKSKDVVPMETKAGVSYKVNDKVLTALDVTSRDDDFNVHIGGESWFADDVIGIRAGGNMKELSFGFSVMPKLVDTADFQIDYSLIWPLTIEETSGTHRVSFTTMF